MIYQRQAKEKFKQGIRLQGGDDALSMNPSDCRRLAPN